MIDPRFSKAERDYAGLRRQFDLGTLDKESFEASVRALMIRHDERFWMIGARSGKWYVRDGGAWMETKAPGAREAAARREIAARSDSAPVAAVPAAASSRFDRAVAKILRRVGIALLCGGAVSSALPMIGAPFRLTNVPVGDWPVIGAAAIIAGGVLLLLSIGSASATGIAPAAGKRRSRIPILALGVMILAGLAYIGFARPGFESHAHRAAHHRLTVRARCRAALGAKTPCRTAGGR